MWGSSGRALGLLALVVVFSGSVHVVRASPPLAPIVNFALLPENDEVSLRLPNDTFPINYDVQLTSRIHSKDFAYDGHVTIEIKCLVATDKIVLHNRVSDITKVTITSGTPATIKELTNFNTDTVTEFLTVQLESPLVVGELVTLDITFKGQHSITQNVGWYAAEYKDDNGEEVWYATTHFEAPNARQAFPCYDEPDRRAPFTFHITHDQSYHALFNMPITEVTE